MTDNLAPERRSGLMSRVKGKNSKPEMVVRSLLHRMGYRFRLHRKDLPGSPDIILPKHRVVLFVHGCFWHRHDGCKKSTTPKNNAEFWQTKFSQNIARDRNVEDRLMAAGWSVVVVWECETNVKRLSDLEGRLRNRLRNGESSAQGKK